MSPPWPKRLFLSGIVFLSQLLGCSDDAVLGDATIELGTGTVAFEPLAAGQRLVLVAGPQGGHHFVVHARAGGIVSGDPTMQGRSGNPLTTFTAFVLEPDGDRRVDDRDSVYLLGYAEEEAGLELPSGRILRIEDDSVADLYDQEVRIVVTVRDRDGDEASDERVVVAAQDPATATTGRDTNGP